MRDENKIQENLRETARRLLREKEVGLVIGYAAGSEPYWVTPTFIREEGQTGRLVWNPFCVNNLAKYLINYRHEPYRVAVVVKGCDSRAVVRLLQDNQVQREKIVVIGIPCLGMVDAGAAAAKIAPGTRITGASVSNGEFLLQTENGNLSLSREEALCTKCRYCENPTPVLADFLLAEEVTAGASADTYEDIREVESWPVEKRSSFWDRHFQRCLRCYACRNICPACTCRECVFDQTDPCWVAKAHNLSENTAFHLIRAMHVAGRCVDCGECERACPVNIPLRLLNQKIIKDIKELFGVSTPGSRLDEMPVLGTFTAADPDEFN